MFTLKNVASAPEKALAGRDTPIVTSQYHFVSGRPLKGPYPPLFQTIYFGMGCYWGAERLMWQRDGVWVTAVGNKGGTTPNPTYDEVCSGRTGHAETVMVVFDPNHITLDDLLAVFWQAHDPTQGMRQGNDIGSQYRSAIFATTEAHYETILASKNTYETALAAQGYGPITTDIQKGLPFYFAETYHQQYLAKNPQGYCGLQGTGVVFCG